MGNFQSWQTFKLRTLYVEKFNINLMGVFVRVQKSEFLHRKTLCQGTSYPKEHCAVANVMNKVV
jgi:hypothetical protein